MNILRKILGPRAPQTRNGIRVMLSQSDGQEQLILETPNGQKLTVKDGPGSIEIVDVNSNSLRLDGGGITVTASAKLTITAGEVEISAGKTVFSGVVQCDTLISNVVMSAVYTPGEGNIF